MRHAGEPPLLGRCRSFRHGEQVLRLGLSTACRGTQGCPRRDRLGHPPSRYFRVTNPSKSILVPLEAVFFVPSGLTTMV